MEKIKTSKKIKEQLECCINNIPKDLIIWKDKIKKLQKKKKRTRKETKSMLEYMHMKSYYEGKIAAYIAILSETGIKIGISKEAKSCIKGIIDRMQNPDGTKPEIIITKNERQSKTN